MIIKMLIGMCAGVIANNLQSFDLILFFTIIYFKILCIAVITFVHLFIDFRITEVDLNFIYLTRLCKYI